MTEAKKKIIIGAVGVAVAMTLGYLWVQWAKLINSQLELNKVKTQLAELKLEEAELKAQYQACEQLMPQLHKQAEDNRARQAEYENNLASLVGLE